MHGEVADEEAGGLHVIHVSTIQNAKCKMQKVADKEAGGLMQVINIGKSNAMANRG